MHHHESSFVQVTYSEARGPSSAIPSFALAAVYKQILAVWRFAQACRAHLLFPAPSCICRHLGSDGAGGSFRLKQSRAKNAKCPDKNPQESTNRRRKPPGAPGVVCIFPLHLVQSSARAGQPTTARELKAEPCDCSCSPPRTPKLRVAKLN